MNEVVFYALPSRDYNNGEALHITHVSTYFIELDEALKDFYKASIKHYRQNFTNGHYGETDHEWVFSHHEVYKPENPELAAIVILRYRPINQPSLAEELVEEVTAP